jgi:hypothetical protein
MLAAHPTAAQDHRFEIDPVVTVRARDSSKAPLSSVTNSRCLMWSMASF